MDAIFGVTCFDEHIILKMRNNTSRYIDVLIKF